MKNSALIVSALIFLMVGIAHFYRYYKSIAITVAGSSIPLDWSFHAGIIAFALAAWVFAASRR